MFSKTGKMIKLRLSFEVNLSTIILGVAGISATVCAFQFFTSKNKKPKGCLKYVLQNLKGSKKDNKVSNLVSAKPSVEPKLSKNKSGVSHREKKTSEMYQIATKVNTIQTLKG